MLMEKGDSEAACLHMSRPISDSPEDGSDAPLPTEDATDDEEVNAGLWVICLCLG